jgi:starch synthase (maltosyl-transferring)
VSQAARSATSDESIDGRARIIIEGVTPSIDAGRFPIKRVVGQTVMVEADVFTDGHDAVRAELCWRRDTDKEWQRSAMKPLGNDRFRAAFSVEALGRYVYAVEAWVDHLLSWRLELARRVEAEDIASALLQGAVLIEQAAARAAASDAELLRGWAAQLRGTQTPGVRQRIALDEERYAAAARYADRSLALRSAPELQVVVDPPLAGFSAWYEFFPRSCSP